VKANFSPAQITLDVTDDSGLLMKVGTNSSLSSSEWVSYNASTTLSVSAMPATVYAQFKDIYGNQTQILSVSTPQTPQRMVYRDLSNPTSDPVDYRLFVSWNPVPNSGNGFAHYRVYSSINGTDYTLFQTIDSRTLNYVVDGTNVAPLDPSTTYYYKVYAEDVDGDTSYFGDIVSKMPTGQGGTDGTPPSITEVNVAVQSQSASVTWLTDETASAAVSYCLSSCSENETVTQSIETIGLSHEIILDDLVPDTTYEYIVGSVDLANNSASSTPNTFHTTPGPQITDVTVSSITNTSATITWNTVGENSSSVVTYAPGTFPNESNKLTKDANESTQTHSVTLTDLAPQQTYYFYVSSQDGGSNLSEDRNVISGIRQYYMLITTGDIIPPVITNVDVPQYTDTQALVSWRTNEPADSKVEWTTTSGEYATSSLSSSYDLSHSIVLSSLTASTKYFYRVISSDKDRNTATSTEFDFTTKEKQYGEAEVIAVTETARAEGVASATRPPGGGGGGSVIVGIAKEEYDKVVAELADKTKAFTDTLSELNTIKNEVLGIATGETTDPKVLLRAVTEKFLTLTKTYQEGTALDLSESDIAPLVSTLRDLAQAVPPPIVTGAPEIKVKSNSATISWKTDKSANSVVAYAKGSDYDSTKENPYSQQSGIIDTYVTEHSVTLDNLLPSTEYHFQIRSSSEGGVPLKTKDFTFTTGVLLPEISDARIEQGDTGTAFKWNTNVLTNSAIRYTPIVNGKADEKASATFGKSDYELAHSIILENLKSGTTYDIELLSTDPYGNTAKRAMPNFTTGKDTAMPVITGVRTEITTFPGSDNKVQAIVFWTTDELSSSQVLYQEGTELGETPGDSTAKTIDMTSEHTVVITNWRPNSVYSFRVVSVDASKNVAMSKDYTVKTPQQKVSIIDVLMSNFSSTFGWTKNFGI